MFGVLKIKTTSNFLSRSSSCLKISTWPQKASGNRSSNHQIVVVTSSFSGTSLFPAFYVSKIEESPTLSYLYPKNLICIAKLESCPDKKSYQHSLLVAVFILFKEKISNWFTLKHIWACTYISETSTCQTISCPCFPYYYHPDFGSGQAHYQDLVVLNKIISLK